MTAKDAAFTGSVPKIYETHLVPLIFEPYAADMVKRLAPLRPARVLEIAAGTGVVTRALSAALPDAEIVATDLNQAMLDQAAAIGTRRKVEWRQADAQQLPFADASFDAVVCQFGVMFFPDRIKGYSEARRVLKPGGLYAFNVWDSLAENEFPRIVHETAAAMFPKDPPGFLGRTPHGYCDPKIIARDLAAAGFKKVPEITAVTARARAASAAGPATGYCQGTPLRAEIEARGAGRLQEATDAATAAIAKRFGSGAVEGTIQALVITVAA
ncbi:MAG: class I SAM-dependent methyltransferase [Nevskiaceae bacterium]